ncbi:MAG: uracil-DNA glycosylase [Thiobacillus sp.]|nr:uracil-DNA glycosylase [Thiobacillus sp.]
MLSRDDVFNELGIGPVWRLREAPASSPLTADALPIHSWDTLTDAVAHCTACKLSATRTQGVLGVGDRNADWLIVGEAPGADEDAQGEPFVGQAGKLLDAMLASIDLARGNKVYITNVLKSRPPGNRNPESDEIAACMPYLLAQIELIRPKVIVALGRFAAQTLLQTDEAIARLRGRVHQYQGVPLIVTYHPAYLLRNLPDKARAWEDLCLARRTYATLAPNSQPLDPQ